MLLQCVFLLVRMGSVSSRASACATEGGLDPDAQHVSNTSTRVTQVAWLHES